MSFVFATLQAVDAALSTSGGGTVDLGAAAGGAAVARVSLSGTNTTSSFGPGAGKNRMVRYLSATPLVNGPALALIGNANRTTSPGEVGFYASDAAGNWTELAKAGGDTALIGSGTAMLFLQATAPVGWTKSTAHDDKALRIVSGGTGGGSGGTVAFSSALGGSSATGSTSLSAGNLPTLGVTLTYDSAGSAHSSYLDAVPNTPGAVEAVAAATLSGSAGYTGAPAGHSHALPFIKYVDAIVCTKD